MGRRYGTPPGSLIPGLDEWEAFFLTSLCGAIGKFEAAMQADKIASGGGFVFPVINLG